MGLLGLGAPRSCYPPPSGEDSGRRASEKMRWCGLGAVTGFKFIFSGLTSPESYRYWVMAWLLAVTSSNHRVATKLALIPAALTCQGLA